MLQGKNKDLQSRLEKSERLVRQLESEVRVRDYKFGKVIGIDGNGGADDNDDFRSIADSWYGISAIVSQREHGYNAPSLQYSSMHKQHVVLRIRDKSWFCRCSRTLSSITKLDEFLARDTEGDFETLGEGTDVPKFLRGTGMVRMNAGTQICVSCLTHATSNCLPQHPIACLNTSLIMAIINVAD